MNQDTPAYPIVVGMNLPPELKAARYVRFGPDGRGVEISREEYEAEAGNMLASGRVYQVKP